MLILMAQQIRDPYPTGSNIEVYWVEDNVWYEGVVIDTRVRRERLPGGRRGPTRQIKVEYLADGEHRWHSLHNN